MFRKSLDKCILTDLADRFGQVNSNRFGQVYKYIMNNLGTDSNKYILTDLAAGFGLAYSD